MACIATLFATVLLPIVVGAAPAFAELEEADETGFLQKPGALALPGAGVGQKKQWPVLIPLRKESVPVERNGKVVAHKTSYSGAISVGRPAQEFRVVFDTGSGHVIVPSSLCESESCAVHRRYDLTTSSTATAINADGTAVVPEEGGDQVTVGFATGRVTGEFARDQVCMQGPDAETEVCVEVSVVTAVEMSTQPFKAFDFDGVFGLGLSALAVAPEFSYMNNFIGARPGTAPQFGFFLGGPGRDAPGGEDAGEIAVGGYNTQRLLTPLKWAPVVNQQLGHWQVAIKAVRIGNQTLDVCKDGSCRAVVDTGTSHLGVPGASFKDFQRQLTVPAGDHQDCREAEAPIVELVLEGFTLRLSPEHYMRPLPVASPATAASVDAPAGADAGVAGAGRCTPRLMPVNMAAPMGPNLFLLGDPILQRYYTVYDWKSASIGFGLANTEGNRAQLARQAPGEGEEVAQLPEAPDLDEVQPEEIFSFMQVTVTVSVRKRRTVSGALSLAPKASEPLALPAP